ncbi:MAG: transporter substrate-binding domain-containing protein [Thermoleophilia bacterium]
MRRRILTLAIALAACAMLSGCGGGGSPTTRTPTDATPGNPLGLIRPGTLTVISATGYPPFEFDRAGNRSPVGFDIDLARAVARAAGIDRVVFVAAPFEEILDRIADGGTADVALSAISITTERAERVDFSDPYFTVNQSIAVRRGTRGIADLDDLRGARIGAQRGTTGADLAASIPDGHVTRYPTIDAAFDALGRGEVQAVVNDLAISAHRAARSGGAIRVVGQVPTQEQYGVAVSRDNPALRDAVNAALARLRADGGYERIYRRWLRVPPPR